MLLDDLRGLRRCVRTLHRTVVEDLVPFKDPNDTTFLRLPTSKAGELSVTTTCPTLMTLAVSNASDDLYGKGLGKASVFDAFTRVMNAPWKSSGLVADNPFTCSMVLRASGLLASHGLATRKDLLALVHAADPSDASSPKRDLLSIARDLATSAPDGFRIFDYPPAMTLGYWMVDAADRLHIDIEDGWPKLALWSSRTFARQVSLMSAHHDALMDPIAMIMAACTLARLRKRADLMAGDHGIPIDELPTIVELREGVRTVFAKQSDSGIWPKYFPLFHYPEGGSNYTFSFEFLEAVLGEFSQTELIVEELLVNSWTRAVKWCESNRLRLELESTYQGWNSGGQVQTLERGHPESWATGTVHMFLNGLDYALTTAIDRLILSSYAPAATRGRKATDKLWGKILDTDVQIAGETRSVLELVESEMIKPLESVSDRHFTLPRIHSALLFGPPGTSKTTLVRAFAERIGWPYVELSPADFLTKGLDRIYERTDKIFADLNDLRCVVILFDELDALVRRRPSSDFQPPLDIAREFLTTTMLPKLAALHERNNAFYFMATNHREFFDDAVIRPGRFDLHLFMGMPGWDVKLKKLAAFLPDDTPQMSIEKAQELFATWFPNGVFVGADLRLFSFGEFRALLGQFLKGHPLSAALAAKDSRKRLRSLAVQHTKTIIALRPKRGTKKNAMVAEYEKDRRLSRLQ